MKLKIKISVDIQFKKNPAKAKINKHKNNCIKNPEYLNKGKEDRLRAFKADVFLISKLKGISFKK